MTFDQIIRREYSFLGAGVSLNIASESIPPRCVQNALNSYCAACFAAPQPGSGTLAREEAAVKPLLAALIGASADEIALTSSTAAGMNIFASGFPFLPGDNVILSEWEHPSCSFPFMRLRETKQIELRFLPKAKVEITAAEIEPLIDARTKAVILSAVQYATGYFADLRELGALCRSRGVLLVVDGMQALGRLPVDVEQTGIDFLACGSKKGLLSVSGCGFLYCRRSLLKMLAPSFVSLHSTPQRGNPGSVIPDDALHFWNDACRFEYGTPNHPGIYCLSQSLALINGLGIDQIGKHTLRLDRAFREGLRGLSCRVLDFSSETRRSGIVAVEVPAEKTASLRTELTSAGVSATLRDGALRVSFAVYNTLGDVERCVSALARCFPVSRPGREETP